MRPIEQMIEEVLSILPELKNKIDYEMSRMNNKIILYTESLRIPKEKYLKLREMGYDVSWGTVASCGMPQDFVVEDLGDDVYFAIVPCFCHPHNYFLEIVEVVG